MNFRNNRGMTTVSTKDPLLLLLRLKMEGYLVDILLKAGVKRKEIIISTLKMIRPGYFRLTIPHNLRSNNQKKLYTIVTTTYLDLEEGLI